MRTTANSLLNTAHYIGAGLISLSVLVIQKYGWRNCYRLVGGMGIVLSALTFFLVKEPERGRQIRILMQNKLREREDEQANEPEKAFTTMSNEAVAEINKEKDKDVI